jgi:hypothetical protein
MENAGVRSQMGNQRCAISDPEKDDVHLKIMVHASKLWNWHETSAYAFLSKMTGFCRLPKLDMHGKPA